MLVHIEKVSARSVAPMCVSNVSKNIWYHIRSIYVYAKLHERTTSANGKKAPLHRWEKKDEGSQQAQTTQSFQCTPQPMIESPARGGARGPSCIPQDGLQPRRWPCASLESQRNLDLTSDRIKTVTRDVYPSRFPCFECPVSALLKAV